MSIEEKYEILRRGQDALIGAMSKLFDAVHGIIQRMDDIEDELTSRTDRPH